MNSRKKLYPVTYVPVFGESADLKVSDLHPNTLNKAIMSRGKTMVGSQNLRVTINGETEEDFALTDVDNGNNLRHYFSNVEKEVKLCISFVTYITVSSIANSGSKKEVEHYEYDTKVSPDVAFSMFSDHFQSQHHLLISEACTDEKGRPFCVDTLREFKGCPTFDLTMAVPCGYSTATVMLMGKKVDIHIPKTITDKLSEESDAYLLAFESLYVEKLSAFLKDAIELKQDKLKGAVQWHALIDNCTAQLEFLNRGIVPTEVHSESARRLLINEVLKVVSDFVQGSWYVEEWQQKSKDSLGWGPLDFTIHNVVLGSHKDTSESEILRQLEPSSVLTLPEIEKAEREERMARAGAAPLKKPKGDGSSSSSSQDYHYSANEAKVDFTDAALWQLGCQCYDRMILKQVDRISGILCSGHRWKHFVMFKKSDGRGLLVYYGEVLMRVLRQNINADTNTVGNKRRASCRFLNEKIVDRGEVEQVMLALLCAMEDDLPPPSDVQLFGAK